jgi:hypothetical protein
MLAILRADVLTEPGLVGAADHGFGSQTVYEPNSRTLFVAAPGSEKVFIFINEGLHWRYTHSIQPASNYANFGFDLAVDGDRLVVGAYGSDRAYVYLRGGVDGETWTQEKVLVGSGQFGYSVDIKGSRIVVGEPTQTIGYNTGGDSGSYVNLSTPGDAVVYKLSSGSWSVDRRLVPDNGSLPTVGYVRVPVNIAGSGTARIYEHTHHRGISASLSLGNHNITGSLDEEVSSWWIPIAEQNSFMSALALPQQLTAASRAVAGAPVWPSPTRTPLLLAHQAVPGGWQFTTCSREVRISV